MKDRKTKLFFAPMAGVGDSAFRTVCMRWGADHVTSEMISAKAVVYGDKKTLTLAARGEEEHSFSIQIFGSEPDFMAKGAKILCSEIQPDMLDINMGCPVHKIVSNHEGSALMKDPDKVYTIVSAVREAIYPIPVSVKIRRGFDKDHINAVDVAKAADRAGARLITVHGRTREQLYAPPVDLEIIRAVKSEVGCEVVGNGDITSPESAIEMLERTGCDHLMIGRGALGRPWIFSQIKSALFKTPEPIIPTGEKLFKEMKTHLDLAVANKGERQAVMESRTQIAWYVKNVRGAAEIRKRINSASTYSEVIAILEEML